MQAYVSSELYDPHFCLIVLSKFGQFVKYFWKSDSAPAYAAKG